MWLAKRAPVWYWLTECPSVEFIGGFLFFWSPMQPADENALFMQILWKRAHLWWDKAFLSQMNRKFDFSAKTNWYSKYLWSRIMPLWHISRNLRILCSFVSKSISHSWRTHVTESMFNVKETVSGLEIWIGLCQMKQRLQSGKNEEMHHLRSYMHKWKNWEFFLVVT